MMFTVFAISHQFKTKFWPFPTPFENFFAFSTIFETKFLPFHIPFETKFCLFTPKKTVHGNLKNCPPQQQQQEQRFPLPDLSAAPQIKKEEEKESFFEGETGRQHAVCP